MCGIAGVWMKDGSEADPLKLTRMRDSLAHRGPDAAHQYVDGAVGLAHRRLAILDLSRDADQPMRSPCGRYTLVYNGEIFNYREFYPELEAAGLRMRTRSDTEVLLHLLQRQGIDALNRLNGFFAFAWWDNQEQRLLLARDRLGVKPLFIAETAEFIAFASEPKALFAWGLPVQMNREKLSEWLLYRHIAGEETIFGGVQRLLPGHAVTYSVGGTKAQTVRWFHAGEAARNHPRISHPEEWFRETFDSSIRYRMISDVPVGTLLSAGLDSSSVLHSQVRQGFSGLSAWNIRFSNYANDESALAARFSAEMQVPIHSHEFTGEDLFTLTEQAMRYSDEPLMHQQDGHLLGIARKARNEVTVLLSGEAADELLGGYVRYKVHDNKARYRLLSLLRAVPEKYLPNDRWKKLKRYMAVGSTANRMMLNAATLYPSDLTAAGILADATASDYRRNILQEAREYFPNSMLRQLMYLEQHTHLCTLNDRNDRTTMGASIECREPFEDFRIVTGLMSLPDRYFRTAGKGKWLLMQTLGQQLPEYIRSHRKIGLSVPWERYFLEEPVFRNLLEKMADSDIFGMPPFDRIPVGRIVNDFKAKRPANDPLMRQLFFMSWWYECVLQGQSQA